MRKLLFITALAGLFVAGPAATSRAQGLALDPSFRPGVVISESDVIQAIEQPDGKRLFFGPFKYVGLAPTPKSNSTVNRLVRLLPGGNQPDAVFNENVRTIYSGSNNILSQLTLLPSGKLLLITTLGLKQLNADGTQDASFQSAITASQEVEAVLPQPDGKLIIAGPRVLDDSKSGVARLEANGARDTSFKPFPTSSRVLTLQADGKVLLGGLAEVTRLLPNGEPDASFAATIPAGTRIRNIAVQADGAILLAASASTSKWPALTRLLPTGAADPGFQTGTNFNAYFTATTASADIFTTLLPGTNASILVQPDGKIVVATSATQYNGTPIGRFVRLLPNGSLDSGFVSPLESNEQNAPSWLQQTPTGDILVAGPALRYTSTLHKLASVALLKPDGTRDMRFTPGAGMVGTVTTIAQQPDGKYVVGGSFTSINGVSAQNLARLHSNGEVDKEFTEASPVVGAVKTVACQADGGVLVGGTFSSIGGLPVAKLARLLPTGAVDGTFGPDFASSRDVGKVVPQPDGQLLVARADKLYRLDGRTGKVDASFKPVGGIFDVLPLADGRILATGGYNKSVVWRMLPSGQLDPDFKLIQENTSSGDSHTGFQIKLDELGRICVLRYTSQRVGDYLRAIRRQPNGEEDPTLVYSLSYLLAQYAFSMRCIAVQADNQILIGGDFRTLSGVVRLLPNGRKDSTVEVSNSPNTGVWDLLVQRDNKIMVGGSFEYFGATPVGGLVRMLNSSTVTSTQPKQPATLAAWPVPAHDWLSVRADAAARPQQAELFDQLGRRLLSQPVQRPEFRLDIRTIPPGTYLLRLRYARTQSTQRIIVE